MRPLPSHPPSAGPAVAELRAAAPPVALYVHVPFCLSLCPYCDFVVYTGRAARGPGSRVEPYLAALHAELSLRADELDERFGGPGSVGRQPLASVYLGGGTPSLLGPAAIGTLLDHVERRFGSAAGAEVTLEANPGPGERGDATGFRAAGVTRLSLGVQSLRPDELRRLGRRHAPADAAAAVIDARRAGLASVSLDLLTDVPGQSLASWRATLAGALALDPDHLSIYSLTLDDPDAEGISGPDGDHLPLRPGARRWRQRALPEQDEDRAADMDALTDELLTPAGFVRYELSNHARPDHQSRHNLAYWRRLPYAALGPGAHAFDGALERRWTVARLDRYLEALTPRDGRAPCLPPGGVDRLDEPTARAESAILALRLREGLGPELAADPRLATGLAWAVAAGLAERDRGAVRLTPRGRLLSNEVFARLLPSSP